MFWLIAGLGNPGLKYRLTRHNLGFYAADLISEKWRIPLSKKSHQAFWGGGQVGRASVIISKPQTFMNQSGLSIKSFISSYGISPSRLIVIHDDMDLQLAEVRIRDRGDSGGHRGVESVIDNLDTRDFLRIRIGIGRPTPFTDPVDFVLGECSPSEMEILLPVIQKTPKMIETIIEDGVQKAMNLFNG